MTGTVGTSYYDDDEGPDGEAAGGGADGPSVAPSARSDLRGGTAAGDAFPLALPSRC